jgi:TonB family protein
MRRVGCFVIALALSVGPFTQAVLAQKKERAERKVVVRVTPVYPELAKRMHIGGVVKVEVVVRVNGSVKSTKPVGGNPVLIDSATDAIRKWKFEVASAETTEVLQVTFEPQ